VLPEGGFPELSMEYSDDRNQDSDTETIFKSCEREYFDQMLNDGTANIDFAHKFTNLHNKIILNFYYAETLYSVDISTDEDCTEDLSVKVAIKLPKCSSAHHK